MTVLNTSRHANFDATKALLDFDNDKEAIVEILKEFVLDIDRRLAELEVEQYGSRDVYISIVHEIANTLGTAWCFTAASDVRATEDELRKTDTTDLEDRHARIVMQVMGAYHEVIELLKAAAVGRDPFVGASSC